MKQVDYIISKEEFQKLKNKINKEKIDLLIERNIEILAREKFDEARYSSDINESYHKALEAYEIYPNNYEYKTYAISQLLNSLEKEEEYLKLINTVNNEILNSKEGLFQFYDENEVYSYRYKDLKYKYCCTLIINNKYDKAFEELKKFNKEYSYIDFKVKHLILNLAIILGKKDDFLNEYNAIDGKKSVLFMLPLCYVFYKFGNYKDALDELKRINRINKYLLDIIINIEDEKLQKEINYSKSKFYITTREEALFCLKYFINLYSDKGFKNFIINSKE